MFTLYRITFAPARKPDRRGLLFTHENRVTERSCAAPTSKVKSHISDRCSHYTGSLLRRHENQSGEGFCSHQKRLWTSDFCNGAPEAAPRRSLKREVTIGHFRVPPGPCIKTRLSAQPLIWKCFYILMQIKLVFTRKVVHLASF